MFQDLSLTATRRTYYYIKRLGHLSQPYLSLTTEMATKITGSTRRHGHDAHACRVPQLDHGFTRHWERSSYVGRCVAIQRPSCCRCLGQSPYYRQHYYIEARTPWQVQELKRVSERQTISNVQSFIWYLQEGFWRQPCNVPNGWICIERLRRLSDP